MGDLVVGLAKSVVEGVITRTQSAIKEDIKLRRSAQRDLVFISGEFEMMQSFLKVADEERLKNQVVVTWVRQIRELANDVEDCIEFVVDLDMETSTWWRRLLPSCVPAAALPVDEAVAEIAQLKARIEDVSRRNKRYSLINDSGSKPEQKPDPLAAVSKMHIEARGSTKRKLGLEDLSQLITNEDDDLQVISVWGTCGDLGMTSLIREAYNDPEVCPDFTCRAWVKLMHPFNPHEFVQCLMAQFYADSCENRSAMIGVQVLDKMKATQENLLKEFEQLVTEKRYLLVLEDLSNMVQWDAIRTFLPDTKSGSRIIVTMQKSEIASLCVGHPYQVLELKKFSVDHSVYAFYRESSRRDGGGFISYDRAPTSTREAAVDWMQKYPLLGRESEMNELRKCLVSARFNSFPVISVWGISNTGKSALVRNLYYHIMLHRELFSMDAWVDVSHPFKLKDFSRSLLLNIHSVEAEDTAYNGTMGIKDPIQVCHKLLNHHRCLVVIDGLQSTEEWDLIQAALVSTHSKSIIIVITVEGSIARYCCRDNKDLMFNVKALEADAALDLFKKEVQRNNPSSPLVDHTGVELQELILKCGGFPRVIVAIAGLLASKTVTLMDTVLSLNQRFMHNLETNLEFDSLRGLFGWMHSNLRASPDFLKPCIFYLSIFPRGHNFRRRRLVRRWIAEDYCRDSVQRQAEEQGEIFFSTLLDLCIIQQPPQLVTTALDDTRMVLWQANGFIHEYISSRQMEENLVCELGASSTLTTQRHLVIPRSWDRDRIVFESMDFSQLRSMTVFGMWQSFFICQNMKLFRVLDLEDASGVKDEDLEQILKLLPRLRFLSLRGCREICQMPGSLGDLRQLQTLDIRHTAIVKLPPAIMKLRKLQYIRAGSIVPAEEPSRFFRRRQLGGVKVPKGIGKLTALRTLGVVNVSASGGKDFLRELRKLTQLRKLGVSGINRNSSKRFFSEISDYYHLESLSVWLDKDNQSCLDDIQLPFVNLRSLKLYGLEGKLPERSYHPRYLEKMVLVKMDLEMDSLTGNDIEFLGKIPRLCILRLRVKQLQDGELNFCVKINGLESRSYEKVKILEIACSSSASSLPVTFGSQTMKNLELLKVDCSSGSAYQFSGLTHLSNLKQVLLICCNDETLEQDLDSQLADHPKAPVLKLE